MAYYSNDHYCNDSSFFIGFGFGAMQIMRILLINIDSTIPNLALAKIAKYHQDKGDEVIWDMPIVPHDKTYVSCVFTKNRKQAQQWEGKAEIGGSGYSLDIKLLPEIDEVKPKINLGFTTRGCIRKCSFCVVPKKEGELRIVGDIYDLWDGKTKLLTLLDNNILAVPEHFKKICSQVQKENLTVDFNQGLDCRLLTIELCKVLMNTKLSELRFAFDDIKIKPFVLRACEILKRCGQREWRSRWYVYIGKNDTVKSALERLNILREHKQGAYLMRDSAVYKDKRFIALASWVNQGGIFKRCSFEDSFNISERMKRYKKYFQ